MKTKNAGLTDFPHNYLHDSQIETDDPQCEHKTYSEEPSAEICNGCNAPACNDRVNKY